MGGCVRLIFAYAMDVLSKCRALRDVQAPTQGHEESGLTIFARLSLIYVWPIPKDIPTNSGSQNCLRRVPNRKNSTSGRKTTLHLDRCTRSYDSTAEARGRSRS